MPVRQARCRGVVCFANGPSRIDGFTLIKVIAVCQTKHIHVAGVDNVEGNSAMVITQAGSSWRVYVQASQGRAGKYEMSDCQLSFVGAPVRPVTETLIFFSRGVGFI